MTGSGSIMATLCRAGRALCALPARLVTPAYTPLPRTLPRCLHTTTPAPMLVNGKPYRTVWLDDGGTAASTPS